MAYTSSGKLPIERASKLGHIKIIQEPRIQRLLEAFERVDGSTEDAFGELSGHVDLGNPGDLENVVAIDGSQACIPNVIQSHKKVAFITAAAVFLSRSEVAEMKLDPIIDPRTLAARLEKNAQPLVSVLPLGGITIPGETVVQSLRQLIDDTLRFTGLYSTLQFLISREWLAQYEMQEHMGCVKCGKEFTLPRSALTFRCPNCSEPHTLSDYLHLVNSPPEDWAKEEVAIGLRDVMETLLLFSFLIMYRDRPLVLKRTLFVKDGPLLLRAQLSRLIEPIRAFLHFLTNQGRSLHLVGIEKSGELVDHLPLIRHALNEPGDYFLPSIKYLHEQINGVPFVESEYRNRVQYGAKVVVRLGPDHIVALNVPTGEFKLEPAEADLYGFKETVGLLAELRSYAFENALIPLVLANRYASIAMKPSTDILEAFARRVLGD